MVRKCSITLKLYEINFCDLLRAFDVELLFIAQSYKMPIEEIAVNWCEIDGSKITPFFSWIQMGRDLLLIWLRYQIGAWKLKPIKQD